MEARTAPEDATIRTAVRVPMRFGDGYTTDAHVHTFHGLVDGREHLLLALGHPVAADAIPLVRMHSECLTGDVFGSRRCDCGPQLRESVELIAGTGGYLLYLRQEGRDIGLYNKLDAYALQDQGMDTFAANEALGFLRDQRDYTSAAQMLRAVGALEIDLLSNNPDKQAQLEANGITIRSRQDTGVFVNAANRGYLQSKIDVTAHSLQLPIEEITSQSSAG